MSILRMFWVCFSPFAKRLFFFEPVIYNIISYSSVLACVGNRVSIRSLILSLIILIYIFIVNDDLVLDVIPIIALYLFIPVFRDMDYDKVLNRFTVFLFLIAAYAIYQNLFGYTSIELNWIRSGLGQVQEVGYFIREDIRPISFLAGTPELTIFFCLYFLYYFRKGSALGCLACLLLIIISGSRGVIVAFSITFFLIVIKLKFWRSISYKKLTTISLILNVLAYITLTIIGPLISVFLPNARLFVFGTFNARVDTLIDFYQSNKPSYFMNPVADYGVVYDNSYLTIVSIFTLAALPLFVWKCVTMPNSTKSFFGVSIFLGYALYADIILSYYALFLIFFCMFSNSKYARRPVA